MTEEELAAAIAGATDDAKRNALSTDLDILNRMEAEAARFGGAVGLDSVSTFECIVDRDRHFFMEMNTRVQVEHRVTELCYSLRFVNPEDLADSFTVNSIVELMVLLAVHGPRLPRPQRIPREGASVEIRLNATDGALKPHAGGVITDWSRAIEGEIRDDQGICLHNPDTDVFMKYHLAGAYDSNIALLLSTGVDRTQCLARMAEILRRTRMAGENLKSNLEFQYGLLSWVVGHDVQTRPPTSFVGDYLTAVGQLRQEAANLDIVVAYDEIEAQHVAAVPESARAIAEIMARKSSLLARVINALFDEPHYLAGWLSQNRSAFHIKEGGIEWAKNPVVVLRDLYHFLNMEAENGLPALYAIWDHDQALLQDAMDFYRSVDETLDTDEWRSVDAELSGEAERFGNQADAVRAAHAGFQLGLEILKVLPYVGQRAGFFSLTVNPDMTVSVPERFRNAETRLASQKALSPPPVASANEILAPSGGMYYSREAPDREPFVQVGDHFDEGDPLFIIEVMKMFNKVYAPFAGTVDAVNVGEDAMIVKRGDTVLVVTPDDETVEETDADRRERVQAATGQFLAAIGFGA